LRKLCEGTFPEVAVLTYAELNDDLAIKPIGKIAMVRS
jgi:type III secretion protein V